MESGTTPSHDVIPLASPHREQVVEALTRAFQPDPLYTYAFPDPERRARMLRMMWRALVKYTLLYGDCHRHTDIRGHGGVDGSILDSFRYGYDPAQLDFMGLGDHNEVLGGRWPDGLRDYSWWYTQKLVDLHQVVRNHRFIAPREAAHDMAGHPAISTGHQCRQIVRSCRSAFGHSPHTTRNC